MSKSLEFYQLERAPFEDGVRDAAAVGTRPLRAALERARRFVEAETAVVCVKGRPGIGKTYFGLALASVLPAGTLIARLGQPAQPWTALHAAIAKGFELDPHSFSVDALHDLRDSERRLVIAIDPVEQLQLDAFTPLLSLLSHAYLPDRRLVQAVLIGDFARLPEAAREGLAQLGSATLELEALPDGDVPSYVQKRLDRAGYRGQPLFSRAACEEIRRRSAGVPREVNRICTAALERAAERRAAVIEPELIRETCAALPAVPPAAPAPAQEELAPAAAGPRAVIGRVKLETRSRPPARPAPLPATAAGQVRRIEPLPPEPGAEPVVQAEPETPLMDAVFVDDDDLPAPAVEPTPRAPAPTWASVAVRPLPAAVEPEPPTPPPTLATAPPVERVEPGVEPAAPAHPAGRAELPPPPPRRERAFPWLHVGISLAASWLVAGGLFWVYAHPERPATSRPLNEAPRAATGPAESSFEATSALPEPEAAQLTSAPAPASPPAPAAPEPAPAPTTPPAAETPPKTERAAAPTAPVDPAPVTAPAPRPIQTAAVPPAAPSAPSASATPAPSPRKPAATPAPPPLHVELRARGREVLYPPRPASAYATPAQ